MKRLLEDEQGLCPFPTNLLYLNRPLAPCSIWILLVQCSPVAITGSLATAVLSMQDQAMGVATPAMV